MTDCETEIEMLAFVIRIPGSAVKGHEDELCTIAGKDHAITRQALRQIADNDDLTIHFPLRFTPQDNIVSRMEALDKLLNDPRITALIRSDGLLGSAIGKITKPKASLGWIERGFRWCGFFRGR